ncbi:MAG TPA: hypothetical protein VFJ65_08080 [Solirubrobacterales bacterium]|nr:hypothetical protein [Solirubrobacterales bacterium]
MAESEETAAILRRALEYPYATPERSYLYREGGAAELPPAGPDLAGRTPLLSYGANAAPEALALKLASLPGLEMPVLRAELEDFDVAYSAHISPYGAVPATLVESAGTRAPVFVVYPNPEQLELLTALELNYDLVTLSGISCRLENGAALAELGAYRSKHGPLSLDGSAVGLAAVRAAGRTLPELDEPAVLDRVRVHVAPELALEQFIHSCITRGGIKPLPELHQISGPPGG